MNVFGLEQNILHFEKLLRSAMPPDQRATVEDLLRRETLQLEALNALAGAAKDDDARGARHP